MLKAWWESKLAILLEDVAAGGEGGVNFPMEILILGPFLPGPRFQTHLDFSWNLAAMILFLHVLCESVFQRGISVQIAVWV